MYRHNDVPRPSADFKPTGVFASIDIESKRFRYGPVAGALLSIAAATLAYTHFDGKIVTNSGRTEYTSLGGLFGFYNKLTLVDGKPYSIAYSDVPLSIVYASIGDSGAVDTVERKFFGVFSTSENKTHSASTLANGKLDSLLTEYNTLK